jgi:RNA polymerase sigma-70 factor (ECF subfamily)
MSEPFTNFSDKELSACITEKGEIDAFGVLYDRYIKVVFNKVLITFGNFQDAEDITHDIFLKIFLRLKTFKGNAAFSSWVYSITNHHIIDIIRTAKNKNRYDHESDMASFPEEPDDEQLLMIDSSILKGIMEQLDEQERMILMLKYKDEMSVKGIMEIFKIKESTAKMRISRAKQKAYKIYKEQFQKNMEI